MGYRLTFYVFYNKKDFVRCCGTARELVKRGFFPNVRNVKVAAHKQNQRRPNSVVKIRMTSDEIRSVNSNENYIDMLHCLFNL